MRSPPEHQPLPPLRAHESDDARRRWVASAIVALALTLVGTFVAMRALIAFGSSRQREADGQRSIIDGVRIASDAAPLQPSILHERSPGEDLAAMRRCEDAIFEALGWHVAKAGGAPAIPDAIIASVATRPRPSTGPSLAPTTPAVTTPVSGVDEGGTR